MKKSLLLSAAALCAAMNVNAEEIVYDFNQVAPQFAIDVYLPAEEPDFGFGLSGNIDLIDKNGVAGPKFIENGPQIVNADNTVDTSIMFDMETGEMVARDKADLSHSFIYWGEKGAARTLIMAGWGNYDGEWGEKDYQAATEEDYIGTRNAIAFNRMSQGNRGCREDTYFQVPAVQGPFTADIYIGNGGGTYGPELKCKVVPVVNGVEQEATVLSKEDFVAKRMYKVTYNYDKTDAPIVRFGCDGAELHIYHIVIKTGEGAGVENVAVDAAAENAPIYNTLGVQVDENYKGLVIKGGKKYIQK